MRLRMFLFYGMVGIVFLSSQASAYKVSAASACKSPDSHPDACSFYDKIGSFPSWTKNYYKKYGDCKENQYDSDNNKYIDSSDIHYHVGHGGDSWDWGYWKTLRAILFEKGELDPSEASRNWGNSDLEWIGFRCCQLLRDDSRSCWANAMDGLHLLCGFKTNSYKRDDFGKIWAEKMQSKEPVYQAWFSALDATAQNGVVARVLAEHSDNWNDRLYGYGYVSSDSPVDDYYHYKTHPSGSPPYLHVDYLAYMRVYEVIPRTVDETYIRDLGAHFGFSPADPIIPMSSSLVLQRLENPALDPCDPNFAVHNLEVYTNSGIYMYIDTARMWPSIPYQQYPAPTEAHSLAENFLISQGLHAPDALAWDVEYPTMCYAEVNSTEPIETHTIGCAVAYARQIEAAPGQLVSVAGAGARLKVYLHTTGDVIGAMGRWRNINWTGNTVMVVTKEQTWDLFVSYGSKISIEPILLSYDRVQTDLNTATLAYYEFPGPDIQNELIPIWIFDVDYYKGSNLLTNAKTFVPAAREYYPPIAFIVSPADESEFEGGATIDFNSVTDTNFGAPPYSYEWTSDVDGLLSNSENFSSSSLGIACSSDDNGVEVKPHIITLKITDASNRSSSESVEIVIKRYGSDLNCDGITNFEDLAIIARQWLEP